MKKIAFAAAALLCLWQVPLAAANDRMDYLAIENRIQDQWVEYAYRYPQITRGESRVAEQRLNSFLREYSQSTALNARLQAKKEGRRMDGETSFTVMRNDQAFFSLVFSSDFNGQKRQKGFVFLPKDGTQLRLEDLFSSPDFSEVLLQASAAWREENSIAGALPTLQDFYLTEEALVLLFPSSDLKETLSFEISLESLSDILSESLLDGVS
ncbi:MAG: DUF4163 domain-containing protein [Oscillospiraceae bacterium]|nr:DUF4163 domain-containing protein [Oscillospiraceae bacterium]